MYVRPKTRQRRLCVALRGQRILRFVQRVLQEWAGVVDTRHAWRKFVVQLDDTHTAKRVRFGFHQWRLHATGTAVAASRNRRLQDQVMVRWTEWTLHQRTRHRHEKLAEQWHTCKTNERSLTAWWTHVQLQRQSRESMTRIQEVRGRNRIQRLWQTWRGRFVVAKRVRQATTWHDRQLLRRMWLGFQVALQLVAVENKRRRAAQALLTRKLSLSMFGRWVQYVAGRRHDRELDALARDLVACHQATRMFHAWKAVHAKRQVQRQWRTQWVHTQLRQAVRQWHALATVLAGRTWTAVSSRRHYATGLFRKVLYAWSDAVALERHLRATAARSVQHLQACQLKQAVARLQLNANSVYRRRVTRRVLGAMRVVAQRSRYIRGMLVDALGVQATAKSKYMFGRWVQFVTQARHAHTVAHAFQSRTLRRRVMQWHDVAKHQRRCRALMESTRRILFGNVVRTSMVAWVFRTYRVRKQWLAVQSRAFCRHRRLGGAFDHWKRLQGRRQVKLAREDAAISHDHIRVCRPCFHAWVAGARKTKKTKQILAVAFRRDATMTMFRCFRGWQQLFRRAQSSRQAMHDYDSAMLGFHAVKAIAKWRKRTNAMQTTRQQHSRAMDFLERRLRAACFDAWVLQGYVRQERQLKNQLAIDHAHAVSTRRRFDRWLEFTYVQYQMAQAEHHHAAALAQHAWSMWMAFMQSRMCTDDEVASAVAHCHMQLRRRVWRRWQVYCVAQLQKRMARCHYAATRLRLYFLAWIGLRDHMERLRHARTYWEASTLSVRFRQWTRFITTRRVRHAQLRVFAGLQQRQAVRRWRHNARTAKQHKRQVLWASSLFYESSLASIFRAWRSMFQCEVHKKLQAKRAVSHLICKGLRKYFERWRVVQRRQRHLREAKHMAELHLAVSRQRRGVRWLREHVQDHHHAQTIWHYVEASCNDHVHRRLFGAWKTYVATRQAKLELHRTAAIHFGGRTQRVIFGAWVAYVVRTRYLKARVYRSRHLYFSSLYSRLFFRLRRFATLKRRLRHVTDQVCRRRRQEWFDRYETVSTKTSVVD
ncbi:hypothetical protein DYB36_001785 [Aphanomyces astaci]|uniref:Sfi1 spindle body domain-containing protein n=1 Tax=Aphanomyces astaci TaxID=112090 RepID=A0A397AZ68_APHAT|nr:hypothetical protein DYB36_001785 [Aphanomyces astaci]